MPDGGMFIWLGDATQSDVFHDPAALGLGRSGALPAGLVQLCPKPRALIHKQSLIHTEREKWIRNRSTLEPFSCPQDSPLLLGNHQGQINGLSTYFLSNFALVYQV